jgi:hypothetical protein
VFANYDLVYRMDHGASSLDCLEQGTMIDVVAFNRDIGAYRFKIDFGYGDVEGFDAFYLVNCLGDIEQGRLGQCLVDVKCEPADVHVAFSLEGVFIRESTLAVKPQTTRLAEGLNYAYHGLGGGVRHNCPTRPMTPAAGKT